MVMITLYARQKKRQMYRLVITFLPKSKRFIYS